MQYLYICVYWYVGYCAYGNDLTVEDCETGVTEVVIFIVSSLKISWEWTIDSAGIPGYVACVKHKGPGPQPIMGLNDKN